MTENEFIVKNRESLHQVYQNMGIDWILGEIHEFAKETLNKFPAINKQESYRVLGRIHDMIQLWNKKDLGALVCPGNFSLAMQNF